MIAAQTFYGQRRPPIAKATPAAAEVDDGRAATTAWREVARGATGQEELLGCDRKGRDDGDRRRVAAVPATFSHRQEIVESLQVHFLHSKIDR